MDNVEKLQSLISKALHELGLDVESSEIMIENSKDPAHGDYASNIALKSARLLKKAPIQIANEIKNLISDDGIENIEVAGPGFINFFMKAESLGSVIEKIIKEGEHYGDGEKKGKKVNVEYVSANPTGDLHLGHTRGAALGDSIATLYEKAGYDVTREYYVNDCGNQVAHLGHSISARYHELFGEECVLGDDDYHGVDLIDIAKSIKEAYGDKYLIDNEESRDFFIHYGIEAELKKIMKDLSDFGVKFDKFSYESDIRKSGKIEKIIGNLKEKGFVYEKDGATYLKTSAFLDDKDRPIIKADGLYTYFMPDIAYHYDKMERGFDLSVDMLGADHHGYINRMRSALLMGGYDGDRYDVDIYQIVKVFQNGEEVKMSKRTGKSITHRELVAEVGKDAVRYFFSGRNGNSHLDFNMDLATSSSKDNPVYYAQYAHARCFSLLNLGSDIPLDTSSTLLDKEKESEILKQLAEFPSMIERCAPIRAPHKVATYIEKLAASIHEYYAGNKIIDRSNLPLSAQRLALMKAAMIVLKEALRILGVSAPEKM